MSPLKPYMPRGRTAPLLRDAMADASAIQAEQEHIETLKVERRELVAAHRAKMRAINKEIAARKARVRRLTMPTEITLAIHGY